jgi:hypothetical protein
LKCHCILHHSSSSKLWFNNLSDILRFGACLQAHILLQALLATIDMVAWQQLLAMRAAHG